MTAQRTPAEQWHMMVTLGRVHAPMQARALLTLHSARRSDLRELAMLGLVCFEDAGEPMLLRDWTFIGDHWDVNLTPLGRPKAAKIKWLAEVLHIVERRGRRGANIKHTREVIGVEADDLELLHQLGMTTPFTVLGREAKTLKAAGPGGRIACTPRGRTYAAFHDTAAFLVDRD
jgi:hypothetical protein